MRRLAVFGLLGLLVACRASIPTSATPPAATPTAQTQAPAPEAGPRSQVEIAEHVLSEGGPPMRVWTYLPPDYVGELRGLILIAPAGSNLVTGMALGEGDRPEHLPYANAGFVVVAYDLGGAVPEGEEADPLRAAELYFRSDGGISNARRALEFAMAAFPEIDPARVYAAGHSSAASVALIVAAHVREVHAVAAFAPVTRVDKFIDPELAKALNEIFAGANYYVFLQKMSAASAAVARRLAAKPVFLFHAADDETVPPQQTKWLFDKMESRQLRHPASTRVVVESGGHYDAMIEEGIPQAIEWFRSLPVQEAAKGAGPTVSPVPET